MTCTIEMTCTNKKLDFDYGSQTEKTTSLFHHLFLFFFWFLFFFSSKLDCLAFKITPFLKPTQTVHIYFHLKDLTSILACLQINMFTYEQKPKKVF